MKNKFMAVLVVVLSVATGALTSCLLLRGGEEKRPSSRRLQVVKTTQRPDGTRKVTKVALKGRKVEVISRERIPASSQASRPPVAKPDDVEEENLTEPQKRVLQELQDALDSNDIRRVRKALSKFVAKASAGGLEGRVPTCMRARAVEALSWFGRKAAVDVLPYMGDADADVAESASSAFESALSDVDMGDGERSVLLTSALRALTDGDQIDTLLNQLNEMRNSVKAQAVRTILTTGSETAKRVMTEQLEDYLGEDVTNVDGVSRWEAMNPDEPDDAETYGGAR